MPSLKCHECLQIKRCKMYQRTKGESPVYLCAPCARDLGYK